MSRTAVSRSRRLTVSPGARASRRAASRRSRVRASASSAYALSGPVRRDGSIHRGEDFVQALGLAPEMEAAFDVVVDHLGEAPELALDGLGPLDQHVQNTVLGSLRKHEVVAAHLRRRLQLVVDTSVPLLDASGVPGEVEVEEIGAVGLEVEALAGGVGGDQDAQGVAGQVGVEAALELLSLRPHGLPVDGLNAVLGEVGPGDGLFEHRSEGAEVAGRVEAPGADCTPRLLLEDAAVDLEVPVDLQGLSLGIVVGAREADARRRGRVGGLHRLHQSAPRTHLDQLAHPGRSVGHPFGGLDQRRHRPLTWSLVRCFALPRWDEGAARAGGQADQRSKVPVRTGWTLPPTRIGSSTSR